MLDGTLGKDVLGYTPRKYDKSVWIKKGVFPNENTYYLMILICVDGIRVVLKDTYTVIDYL